MRLTDVKWNPGVYYSEQQDHTTKIDYFYLSNNIFMPSRHFSTYTVSSGFYFDLRHSKSKYIHHQSTIKA